MRLIKTTLAAAALLAGMSAATAHDYKAGNLHIEHPWSRATPPNAPVGGGYMTIENNGGSADRLLGGSTPVADAVEVHAMTMEGDVMKMRKLEDGVEIPAGGSVALEPGGNHLMLVGLSKPLKQGTRVPLTLRFEKAGTVDVELAVDSMGAMSPGGAKQGAMGEMSHHAH